MIDHKALVIEVTYEQLKTRLGLPDYTRITLLRQEPEDIVEGKIAFILEVPSLPENPQGSKLRRVNIKDVMVPSWERDT